MFKVLLPNGYTEVDIGRMQRWVKPDVDILMQRHVAVMGIAKLFWSTWILQGAHIYIYIYIYIYLEKMVITYLFYRITFRIKILHMWCILSFK